MSTRALERRPGVADIAWNSDAQGAVSKRRTIELQLAETGTELWPALEAAQYARLISRGAPASAAEEQAVGHFIEVFGMCAETWEELHVTRRAGALAGLSARLEALHRCGLFVHWAAIDGGIAETGRRVTMPIAVLAISRSDLPTVRMELAAELEVAREGGPTSH
jgi:hypothetical protein